MFSHIHEKLFLYTCMTLKQILPKISVSIEQRTVLAMCLIHVQTLDRYSQDWTSMYRTMYNALISASFW
jgi:hypothetical protein